MTAQLSLLDAAPVHADTGDDHQWMPGEDVAADIDAVLSMIPNIGTSKAWHRRPIACLYVRTALLPEPDRRVCQAIARACTGFDDAWDGFTNASRTEPIWIRLNGEGAGRGVGRMAAVAITPNDRRSVWMVSFRSGDATFGKAKHWLARVRPGLRVLGCEPSSRVRTIRLPSLAPLILALRWSDAVESAVFLAGSGVAPKSPDWTVLVDLALAHGRPWSETLAELSARHPRDVMIRALGWVHAQGIERRRAR